MIEKIYLTSILLFFILAFVIRNIKTQISTRQPIRGKSLKLTLSILITTIIYCLLLLRLTFLEGQWMFEFEQIKNSHLRILGIILVSMGFVSGLAALITMKNSWRVGIKYEQKTELVQSGIYRISRNPYFLSYNILILGYLFIYPSFILFLLYIILVFTFHFMILEEEKYLLSVHKKSYTQYQREVKRYFGRKVRSKSNYLSA